MPTLPIQLEVEAEAVGPVLILLHKTPGVIKFHVVLDDKSPTAPLRNGHGHGVKEAAIKFFVDNNGGPLDLSAVARELGSRTRAHGALYNLKKEGVIKTVGKSTYQMTARAMAGFAPPLSLPPPAKQAAHKANGHKKTGAVKRGPRGRVSTGTAPAALIEALTIGGMRAFEIRNALGEKGISPNSISGVLDRAKRDGLIKKVGDKYELTAKAKRTAAAPAAAVETGG